MHAPRLHWMRGRQEEGSGIHRTLEWVGRNDAGEAIADAGESAGEAIADAGEAAAETLDVAQEKAKG